MLPLPRHPGDTAGSCTHSWFSHVRGDIAGGLMSAVVAIPLAIGFGMFAFVSLGDEFFATGALAGLCAACALGIAMVVLGSGTTAVYAPRVNTTFVIGSLLYGLVHSDIEVLRSGSSLFAATFLSIMLLAGAFQALFGLARLGTLIKHTPHPVMAGFQNAAALLLFLVQLGNVLGLEGNVPFTAVAGQLDSAKPLSVLVAAVTFAVMWNSRKIVPRVPPLLVGLAVGTALYYGLAALGLGRPAGTHHRGSELRLQSLLRSRPTSRSASCPRCCRSSWAALRRSRSSRRSTPCCAPAWWPRRGTRDRTAIGCCSASGSPTWRPPASAASRPDTTSAPAWRTGRSVRARRSRSW